MRSGQTEWQTAQLPYAVAPPLGVMNKDYTSSVIAGVLISFDLYTKKIVHRYIVKPLLLSSEFKNNLDWTKNI